MISQTETAGDTVGGTQEALGDVGHIQTGAAWSVGLHRHTGLTHVSVSPTSSTTGCLCVRVYLESDSNELSA